MDSAYEGLDITAWPPRLGPDPPAIANLVVHDGRLTRAAVSATLLDLAARKYLAIDAVSSGTYVCRLRHEPEDLVPYEQMVYDTVADNCVDGAVPVEMLTRELRYQPRTWMDRFHRSVTDEAKEAGLVEIPNGWGAFDGWAWLRVAVLAIVLLVVIAAADGHVIDGTVAGALFLLVLVVGGTVGDSLFDMTWRLTPEGRVAASGWRTVQRRLGEDGAFADLPPTAVVVWHRYLAYGVALHVAHAAATALPMGEDDSRRAWSAATGRWRRLHVTYPRRRPLMWGVDPVRALVTGLVTGVIAVWLLVVLARPGPPYPNPPFSDTAATAMGDVEPLLWVLALALAAWSAVVVGRSVADLLDRRTVTGRVVRVRSRRGTPIWFSLYLPTHWFVVFDDGTSDEVRALRVRRELVDDFVEGTDATIEMTSRLGYVRSVSRT